MKLTSLGPVMARRVLRLGGRKKVTVELGKPHRFRGGAPDYYCPFRLRGLGDERVRYGAGVDAFQALELALQAIGFLLYFSAEAKAGKLSWDAGQAPGDVGFPVSEVAADLLPKKVREVYVRKSLPTPPKPRAKRRRAAKRG